MTPSRINILFVMTRMEMGGSERLIHNLALHLDRSRFSPSLVWFYGDEVLQEFRDLQVPLSHVPKLKRFDPGTMRQLAAVMRDQDIHVVNAHHFLPFVYSWYGARTTGAALTVTFHSEWELQALPRRWQAAGGLLLRGADSVISVSNEVRAAARQVFGTVPSRSQTIRNGIDVHAFSACSRAQRQELGIPGKDVVIGMVANFKTVKNHLLLLAAFRQLVRAQHPVRLLLVGRSFPDPDNTEQDIRNFIKQNGLADRVILAGYRSDVPALLGCMDIFCLCSLREGLPISMIEAMASGLPVVGTRVEGIKDVVLDGQNGFLVDLNDETALTEALGGLVRDAPLRQRLGARSRELAREHYGLRERIKEYEQLFSALAARRRAAGRASRATAAATGDEQ